MKHLNEEEQKALAGELEFINNNYQLVFYQDTGVSGAGKLLEKVSRRATRSYLVPLSQTQMEFNAHVVRALNKLGQMTGNYDQVLLGLQKNIVDSDSYFTYFDQEREIRQKQFELLEEELRKTREALEDLTIKTRIQEKEIRRIKCLIGEGTDTQGRNDGASEQTGKAVMEKDDQPEQKRAPRTLGFLGSSAASPLENPRQSMSPSEKQIYHKGGPEDVQWPIGSQSPISPFSQKAFSSSSSRSSLSSLSLSDEMNGILPDAEENLLLLENLGHVNPLNQIEEIHGEKKRVLLSAFEKRKKVLNLRSGRGEFLGFCKESGIHVTGADSREYFAEFGQMHGYDCQLLDELTALEREVSLDGVYSRSLVECLGLEQIVRLLHLSHERLEPGSCLVLETLNPSSVSMLTEAFVLDLPGIKPIHADFLKYLAEQEGFRDVRILYGFEENNTPGKTNQGEAVNSIPELISTDGSLLNLDAFNSAMKKLGEKLYGNWEYALIARK